MTGSHTAGITYLRPVCEIASFRRFVLHAWPAPRPPGSVLLCSQYILASVLITAGSRKCSGWEATRHRLNMRDGGVRLLSIHPNHYQSKRRQWALLTRGWNVPADGIREHFFKSEMKLCEETWDMTGSGDSVNTPRGSRKEFEEV